MKKVSLPPPTPANPVTDTLHGVLLTDQYRWLEEKTDPKVIEWTKTQHDYGIQYLESTQKTHAGLCEGIAAFIDLDYEGLLDKKGKRVFQSIKQKGGSCIYYSPQGYKFRSQ
jgi:prolyl oligopeptidase